MYKTITFESYASVNSSCGDFAHLVSPRGGALANLARPGSWALANPRGTPEKGTDVFKGTACFLNYFNKYFNLKSYNFKANAKSVYKLSCFATCRMFFIL